MREIAGLKGRMPGRSVSCCFSLASSSRNIVGVLLEEGPLWKPASAGLCARGRLNGDAGPTARGSRTAMSVPSYWFPVDGAASASMESAEKVAGRAIGRAIG